MRFFNSVYLLEEVADSFVVAQVGIYELRALGERVVEVVAPARGEVVEDRDLVAARDQRIDHVRADEAGASGN